MATEVPPGWYSDPAGPAGLRWWDGTGWTAHVSPAGRPVAGAAADLQDEGARAARARVALLVAIPAQLMGLAVSRLQLRSLFARIGSLESESWRLQAGSDDRLRAIPMQLSGAVGIIVGVLFLLWFVRSASNAESLGLAARREPAAGVAGFVVPVINLWWPYQSTCDLLPAGDPHRPLVLAWFLLWVVGGVVGAAVSWGSVFVAGWGGWLLLAVPAVLTTLAALAARRVVAEVVAAHAGLARRPLTST